MAEIKIYTPIVGEEQKRDMLMLEGVNGFSFSDMDSFLDSIEPGDKSIMVKIHCPGGNVMEGWAAVDKLRATGKEITTLNEGICASMATILYLAGSKRKAYPHSKFCIHDPYIPGISNELRVEDLEKISEHLREERERLLDFYVERTNADRQVLSDLMKEDKYIDVKQAQELGFVHEIISPASASVKASSWQSSITKNNLMGIFKKKEPSAEALAQLKEQAAALGYTLEPVVAYELSTQTGGTITIDKPEGEPPAIGDNASPDGAHPMPDGQVIVIENGIIVDIIPENNELAEAKAHIEELKAKIEELELQAKTKEDNEILALVKAGGGRDWLVQARSTYQPQARITAVRQETAPSTAISRIERELAEKKEKLGIK